MLPRLWYSVTSLSQSGTLTCSSPAGITGLYGKLTSASSGGNVSVPAKSRSSKTLPLASRYGDAAFET